MQAARIYGYGGPESVVVENVDIPVPTAEQVLVRVVAAGVNPVDWKIREGYLRQTLPLNFPLTLGCDAAGTIEQMGDQVHGFRVGDAVFGYPSLMRCGAFAEFVLFDQSELSLAPRSMPLAGAAALPVAAITAYDGLFTHGKLAAGQTVLILGGAGGVGSLATQLAIGIGAGVFATASTRNQDLVRSFGATPIDYLTQLPSSVVQDVDLIFDCVGAESGLAALPSLRRGGIYSTTTYELPPAEALAAVEAQPRTFGIQPSGPRLTEIARLVDQAGLRIAIEQVYSLRDVGAALAASQAGRTRGKLLIRP